VATLTNGSLGSRVLDALREMTKAGSPAAARSVAKAVEVSPRAAQSTLRRLVEQGLVELTTASDGSPAYRLARIDPAVPTATSPSPDPLKSQAATQLPQTSYDAPPIGQAAASGDPSSPAAAATGAPLDPIDLIGRGVVPPMLQTPEGRRGVGLPVDDDERGRYMIELNNLYPAGLGQAAKDFEALCGMLTGPGERRMRLVSKSYFRILLSCNDWRALLKADEAQAADNPRRRIVYKLWPDFEVRALVDRSVATVKADAALRSYAASGEGITWAVVDSGIDGTHPHFGSDDADKRHASAIHHADVRELHHDFTDAGANIPAPLVDGLGHGTHVAGIIAGGLPDDAVDQALPVMEGKLRYIVYEQAFVADAEGSRVYSKQPVPRTVRKPESLHGVAPGALLVSLKVLNELGRGFVSDVMEALAYVREQLNDDPKNLRVHGVNLSLGYEFDPQMFACGQSPLCVEVNRLVKSGVVVVAAAGNTGYGNVSAAERVTKVGLSNTINDPGNAALAITVGSTHRDSPHMYGVSFFSSKGPTGDGRLKPDLVAPGERITSCAAEAKRKKYMMQVEDGTAAYIDDSGTSMAAPHVSGAVAAFLSIRREFIQRPEEVKRIFLDSATSLGRERYFEGHGLVDLMRAIQSV
jgi:subtilisin family serine protease